MKDPLTEQAFGSAHGDAAQLPAELDAPPWTLSDLGVGLTQFGDLQGGAAAVQVGAGPLALGHNVPVLDACGLSVVLASRAELSSNRARMLRLADTCAVRKVIIDLGVGSDAAQLMPFGHAFDMGIAGFVDTSTSQGRRGFVDAVSDPEVTLLILALREGLKELASSILEGLAMRSERMTIVSCENIPPENWHGFVAACHEYPHIDVIESMVDRICIPPAGDVQDAADVYTEDFRLWVLPRDRNGILASTFAPEVEKGRVEIVDDVRPYRLAKTYVVNSLQLALATHAAAEGEALLHNYIRNFSEDRDGASPDRLHDELLLALNIELAVAFPETRRDFGGERALIHKPLRRLRDFPDPVDRLLQAFRPSRLREFRRAVEHRIKRPRDILREHGLPSPALDETLGVVQDLWSQHAWRWIHGVD